MISTVFMALLSWNVANADDGDWKTKLSGDIVKIVDGKMVENEYSMCSVTPAGAAAQNVQLKIYAEAPTDAGISRDFFVQYTAMMKAITMLALGGGDIKDFKAPKCHRIDAPIGKVDLTMSIYMTKDGYQIEVAGPDGTVANRSSALWADTLK